MAAKVSRTPSPLTSSNALFFPYVVKSIIPAIKASSTSCFDMLGSKDQMSAAHAPRLGAAAEVPGKIN